MNWTNDSEEADVTYEPTDEDLAKMREAYEALPPGLFDRFGWDGLSARAEIEAVLYPDRARHQSTATGLVQIPSPPMSSCGVMQFLPTPWPSSVSVGDMLSSWTAYRPDAPTE